MGIRRFLCRLLGCHSHAEVIAKIVVDEPVKPDLKAAIDMIKEFEGLRLEAYLDPIGIPTIGWGQTEGVKMGDVITRSKAEELLMSDILNTRLPGITRLVKTPINNNELCALISFSYNVGLGALERSTLLKMLNAGQNRSLVADEFDKWVMGGGIKWPGLVRRRAAEKALFLKPYVVQTLG
jgi:lysozyme